LLVLGTDGKWKQPVTFGRVQDDHTRPIVLIDEQNRNLYMFATAPVNGGTIYYKQAPLGNISFANGKGTPFIQSSTDTTVNNATSTKQNVNSASGLVVLASDHNSKYYLHNTLNLSSNNADTVAPTVSAVAPTEGTTDVAVTANTEATFSEAMDPATVTGSTFTLTKQGATTPVEAQVSYDPATKKATLDPSADLEAGATYTATLKGGASGAKDAAGNPLAGDNTWSFGTAAAPPPPADTAAPDTTIDSGPSGTITVADAAFAFSSSEANSTFECSLDGQPIRRDPLRAQDLPKGATFEVRAGMGSNGRNAAQTFAWTYPPRRGHAARRHHRSVLRHDTVRQACHPLGTDPFSMQPRQRLRRLLLAKAYTARRSPNFSVRVRRRGTPTPPRAYGDVNTAYSVHRTVMPMRESALRRTTAAPPPIGRRRLAERERQGRIELHQVGRVHDTFGLQDRVGLGHAERHQCQHPNL
jgi:hypothetical protein